MNKKLTGAILATAVAGLFLAGTASAEGEAGSAAADQVCCKGGNSCKGQGACKGDSNACAGENGCKGKGWVKTSSDACKEKGGTVVECPAH